VPTGILLLVAGVAIAVAVLHLWGLCVDGNFERCMNGKPNFDLVFQLVPAAAGLGAAFAVRLLVNRSSYLLAGGGFAIALLVLAAWALFLDAATHGWDDLRLLWLG
jgi:hypothetical protein